MFLWSCILLVILQYSNEAIAQCTSRCNQTFVPKGLYPAVFTPITKTGYINITGIPMYAQYLNNIGVDGVVVTGTNGEGPNQSTCEKKKIIRAWVKEAKKYGFKVIAQIGGVAKADIFELARFSVRAKVDAILLLPTLYYAPRSPENLVELIKVVSDEVPSMPVLYYHFPEYSNVRLDMGEFFKLASERIPQFKGIKADLPTAVQVKAVNDLRSDQTILVSNGILLSAAVALGYDAFTTTLLNICPDLVLDVMKYTRDGEMMKARQAQEKLNRVSAAISNHFYTLPAYKAAATIVTGIDFGIPRLPVKTISKEGEQNIRRILKENKIKTYKNNT